MSLDLDQLTQKASGLVSEWGLQVVGAIAVLVFGFVAARIARGMARRGLGRTKIDPTLIPFLSGMVYYLLLAFVLIAVLELFGVKTTSMVAVVGAAGFAVGLALQGTLSNFSAGVMLLVFRPFKAGDYVEAAGSSGTVVEVGIFSTTLHTPDNVKIIVPNSGIYGQTIKNYSANETRRIDLVIGVGYSDNLSKATEVISAVLKADARVLADPAPQVAVSELADSSVNFVVRPWCNGSDYWALRFDLTQKLKEEIEGAGLNIPFPQRDVHMFQAK